MKKEPAPLLWKGEIVGYVDEFDDDSTVFFGSTSLQANKKLDGSHWIRSIPETF